MNKISMLIFGVVFFAYGTAHALPANTIKANIEAKYNDIFSKDKIPTFLSSYSKNSGKVVDFLNAIAEVVKFVDENNKGVLFGASENLTDAKRTLALLRNDLIKNFNELETRFGGWRLGSIGKDELKNLVHSFIDVRAKANIPLKNLKSLGESHYNSKGQKESFQLLVLALTKLTGVSSYIEDVLERL